MSVVSYFLLYIVEYRRKKTNPRRLCAVIAIRSYAFPKRLDFTRNYLRLCARRISSLHVMTNTTRPVNVSTATSLAQERYMSSAASPTHHVQQYNPASHCPVLLVRCRKIFEYIAWHQRLPHATIHAVEGKNSCIAGSSSKG